jgi:TM2 domain-containing membrane protein YozV
MRFVISPEYPGATKMHTDGEAFTQFLISQGNDATYDENGQTTMDGSNVLIFPFSPYLRLIKAFEREKAMPKICATISAEIRPIGKNKSRKTAAWLALIFGGCGLHKFYMGSVFMGILYAAFCWTFIPMAFSVLEAVYYFTMDDDAFDRKYNGAI